MGREGSGPSSVEMVWEGQVILRMGATDSIEVVRWKKTDCVEGERDKAEVGGLDEGGWP